jgi:hypothetical protein
MEESKSVYNHPTESNLLPHPRFAEQPQILRVLAGHGSSCRGSVGTLAVELPDQLGLLALRVFIYF